MGGGYGGGGGVIKQRDRTSEQGVVSREAERKKEE